MCLQQAAGLHGCVEGNKRQVATAAWRATRERSSSTCVHWKATSIRQHKQPGALPFSANICSPIAQVAAALLGASLPTGNCQVRILAMIGGPCTEGGGRVVSR